MAMTDGRPSMTDIPGRSMSGVKSADIAFKVLAPCWFDNTASTSNMYFDEVWAEKTVTFFLP